MDHQPPPNSSKAISGKNPLLVAKRNQQNLDLVDFPRFTIETLRQRLMLHKKEGDLLITLLKLQHQTAQDNLGFPKRLRKQFQQFWEKDFAELEKMKNRFEANLTEVPTDSTPSDSSKRKDLLLIYKRLEAFEKRFNALRLKILNDLIQEWPLTIY